MFLFSPHTLNFQILYLVKARLSFTFNLTWEQIHHTAFLPLFRAELRWGNLYNQVSCFSDWKVFKPRETQFSSTWFESKKARRVRPFLLQPTRWRPSPIPGLLASGAAMVSKAENLGSSCQSALPNGLVWIILRTQSDNILCSLPACFSLSQCWRSRYPVPETM